MDVARKLIELLSSRERLQLVALFAALLVVACLEMVSVASVLPFLSVAADPSRIQSNEWLAWVYGLFGFTSTNGFLLALAGASLLALIVTNAAMAAGQWGQIRFALARNHRLSCRLLDHYLAQPYVFFLRRNSMDLGKNILGETDLVTAVLIAALRLAGESAGGGGDRGHPDRVRPLARPDPDGGPRRRLWPDLRAVEEKAVPSRRRARRRQPHALSACRRGAGRDQGRQASRPRERLLQPLHQPFQALQSLPGEFTDHQRFAALRPRSACVWRRAGDRDLLAAARTGIAADHSGAGVLCFCGLSPDAQPATGVLELYQAALR